VVDVERLTGPLADALARQRDLFNAHFANARHGSSALDAAAFAEHLATTLDPIIRAVAQTLPEKIDEVTVALFDLSLELFELRLLGPEAKTPWVMAVWRELLPAAATAVAREPARLAASASNAIVNLATTPGARPRQWLDRWILIAAGCPDVTTLLDCGKVLAWQAGMAQYRASALEVVAQLMPSLAAAALGLPQDTAADSLSQVIERLKTDPWITAVGAVSRRKLTSPIRLVAMAGAFRGLGGPFLRPPTVAAGPAAIYASDGDSVWQLLADAYGAVFVGCDSKLFSPSTSSDAAIGPNGEIRWGSDCAQLENLAHPLSWACDATTLAVTLPTSHHVFLLGRAAEN
jgi:hypothetical protein